MDRCLQLFQAAAHLIHLLCMTARLLQAMRTLLERLLNLCLNQVLLQATNFNMALVDLVCLLLDLCLQLQHCGF